MDSEMYLFANIVQKFIFKSWVHLKSEGVLNSK
jgi:hypothetical protein